MTQLHVDLVERPDWKALDIVLENDMRKYVGRIQSPLALPWKPGTLTIAMIVKNEAANIRAALESFKAIADEIVVNDTGSTDGTQAILEEMGVKWFQGDWRNDFSYARNLALDQATSSWVLWMDADDRIPEAQIENFLKLKTAPLDRGFGFQVINTQGGLPIGGRFMQMRMFPNHPQLRFRYRIHEQVLQALVGLGLHLFYTDTTLYHTGYEDPTLKKAKAQRNLDLLAQESERIKQEPALAMSVGDSHFILAQWEAGIQAYLRVWEMPGCEKKHFDVYAEIPACIGRGLQYLGRREEAITWLDKSIALQPNKVEPYYYRAECLMELGRKSEAEANYLRVTEMPLTFTATANQYDVVRIYSFYHLARLVAERGDVAAAIGILERMQSVYDQVVESWILLGQCHLKLDRFPLSLAAFERAISINPKARPEAFVGKLACLKALQRSQDYADTLVSARLTFPLHLFSEWFQASQKAKLSLCLIVKNEAKNLPACLDSVGYLADEIVIVDTGSSDATVAIARQRGAVVLESAWQGDFSLARNVGLDRASGDFILWLDADDRLLPKDRDAIRTWVDQQELPAAKAFGFLVKNSGDGGLTGSVFNQIRLFPNRGDIRFESPIHEQVLPSLERARIPVQFLNIMILHTGYADPTTALIKQRRNRDLLKEQVEKNNNVTPITFYTLGHACFDLGDFSEAETWFRQAGNLAKARGNNPHVLRQVPVKIAVSLAARHLFDAAWIALQPALLVDSGPIPPEALLVKAQVLAALGREEDARLAYEDLLDIQEGPTFMPVDFSMLKVKALQYLGCYWHAHGSGALAIRLLRSGLEVPKGRDYRRQDLLEAYRS